jgi:hypothetical protein
LLDVEPQQVVPVGPSLLIGGFNLTLHRLADDRSLSTTPVDMGGQYSKHKGIAGRDHDH